MKLEDIKPGLYWVKYSDGEKQKGDIDYIAKVAGTIPFLSVQFLFNPEENDFMQHCDIFEDYITWGPRIELPVNEKEFVDHCYTCEKQLTRKMCMYRGKSMTAFCEEHI